MIYKIMIRRNNQESTGFLKILMQVSLLIGLLSLVQQIKFANGETKEFDWSELGVALSSPKNQLGTIIGSGGSAANNLRILVSPQRRVSKK